MTSDLRGHSVGLRTESTSYQLRDLSINKNIDNLPVLRQVLGTANERYLEVQQDVLTSYIDRGQLQQLRRPTVSPEGRRVPGMRVDDPRLMAVLQAIICFAYLAGRGRFRTKDLLPDIHKATGNLDYKLSQLRYDLGKLRGKGLLLRQRGTQWYQVTSDGYRLAILCPWQPFVHYEFRGVKKNKATLWYGYRYPVDGDTAGRAAFGGIREFMNPDFAGKASYEDKTAAGVGLVRGIIDAAHQLGISATGLTAEDIRQYPKVNGPRPAAKLAAQSKRRPRIVRPSGKFSGLQEHPYGSSEKICNTTPEE